MAHQVKGLDDPSSIHGTHMEEGEENPFLTVVLSPPTPAKTHTALQNQ